MKNTQQRLATAVLLMLLSAYLIALFRITLHQDGNLQLRSVSIVPFTTISEYIGSIISGNKIIAIFNLLGNLMLFFPLGFLTPSIFPKMRFFGRALMFSLVVSLAIEVSQFILSCGSSDVDDLLLNTIGGGLGYGVYACVDWVSNSKKYVVVVSIIMISIVCAGYYARNSFQFILPLPPMLEAGNRFVAEQKEVQDNSFANITINSSNALLIQLNKGSNKVLFEKKPSERVYPASMTKIMTAIIAIGKIKDLDSIITLNDKMFAEIYSSNSSVAGFLPGERVCAIDLLYGLMLPSGAECAVGLAEYLSGTQEAFVDLMNEKAHQLSMNNTNFTNASGLHDNNHYSTAADIAILLEYAIKNDTFYKIFTATRYSTQPTNRHRDGITFYSTLFSNMKTPKSNNEVILGGKTGFTSEAGQCLASYAQKNGKRFILITCGAPGDNNTQYLNIEDAMMIFNNIN